MRLFEIVTLNGVPTVLTKLVYKAPHAPKGTPQHVGRYTRKVWDSIRHSHLGRTRPLLKGLRP